MLNCCIVAFEFMQVLGVWLFLDNKILIYFDISMILTKSKYI